MDFEQPRLLIVEDDEGDFMLIERAFGKARIVNELVRAKDGVEALEIIRGTNGADRFRRPFLYSATSICRAWMG